MFQRTGYFLTSSINKASTTEYFPMFNDFVDKMDDRAQHGATSFPGSFLFTPQEAREERPWSGLVTCLPKYGSLQISDWREGRLSVSLPILSVPGMGKHVPVRINLQNLACFEGHVKWSRNQRANL